MISRTQDSIDCESEGATNSTESLLWMAISWRVKVRKCAVGLDYLL